MLNNETEKEGSFLNPWSHRRYLLQTNTVMFYKSKNWWGKKIFLINIWAHGTTRILSGKNPKGNYLVSKVAFSVVYIFELMENPWTKQILLVSISINKYSSLNWGRAVFTYDTKESLENSFSYPNRRRQFPDSYWQS